MIALLQIQDWYIALTIPTPKWLRSSPSSLALEPQVLNRAGPLHELSLRPCGAHECESEGHASRSINASRQGDHGIASLSGDLVSLSHVRWH